MEVSALYHAFDCFSRETAQQIAFRAKAQGLFANIFDQTGVVLGPIAQIPQALSKGLDLVNNLKVSSSNFPSGAVAKFRSQCEREKYAVATFKVA
jgi:hypothetical protein